MIIPTDKEIAKQAIEARKLYEKEAFRKPVTPRENDGIPWKEKS